MTRARWRRPGTAGGDKRAARRVVRELEEGRAGGDREGDILGRAGKAWVTLHRASHGILWRRLPHLSSSIKQCAQRPDPGSRSLEARPHHSHTHRPRVSRHRPYKPTWPVIRSAPPQRPAWVPPWGMGSTLPPLSCSPRPILRRAGALPRGPSPALEALPSALSSPGGGGYECEYRT